MKLRVFVSVVLVFFLTVSISQELSAETKYKEGLEALYAGKYNEAIAFFKRQVEKEKDTGQLAVHSSFLLGLSYYKNGQYPEAIEYLKRTFAIAKEGMHIWRLDDAWSFWLGRAYYDNNDFKEAASWFREATTRALINPSTKYNDMGNYPQVRFAKQYYIPLAPSRELCYYWLGRALYSGSQYEEAIGAINMAIELAPKDADNLALLAASYRELQKFDQAITAAQKAIELQPNSRNYRILGSVYRAQKEYGLAIEYFKKALGLEPENAEAYLDIARIYLAEGKYPEAEETLKKAPPTAPISSFLMTSLLGSGKLEEALSVCDREIERRLLSGVGIEVTISDRYPVISSVIASFPAQKSGLQVGDRIISLNGNSTKGLKAEQINGVLYSPAGTVVSLTIERNGLKQPLNVSLTSESKIHTSAAEFYGMKSLILAQMGNLEGAAKEARNAHDLDPEQPWARRALCLAAAMAGSQTAGQENLEGAIKMLSGSTDSLDRTLLAIAQAKANNQAGAAETFSLLSDDFLHSTNKFHQGFVELALKTLKPYVDEKKKLIETLERNKQIKEALKEYAILLQLSTEPEAGEIRKHLGQLRKTQPEVFELPEEARKHILRAEVLNEDKNFSRAMSEYREALKTAFFHPDLYKAMALTAEAMKDYRQAIRSMTAYLELNPDTPEARELKDKIIKWEFLLEEQKK